MKSQAYRDGWTDGFYSIPALLPNEAAKISRLEYQLGYNDGKTDARRVHEATKNGTPTGK